MGFSLHLERFLFVLSVCVYYVGHSSAETNSRNPSGSGIDNPRQASSYFFYQPPKYPRDCREVLNQCSSSMSSGVYLIKPDGYPEPFEVYCNNEIDFGGWTVIQRRLDGSLDFHRMWEEYKRGFGFLSSEFWLGNERISFLTSQNVYELRTDIFFSNNNSFHITFNSFRISDEWGKFALAAAGNYTGNAGSVVTLCPQNMVFGNCTCTATCQDPLGTSSCQTDCEQSEDCVCREGFLMNGEHCVSPTECGCYVSEENRVLQNRETHVNTTCTEKCTCNDNQLNCDTNYRCSQDAACTVKEDVRQCYCSEGYTGDGETCTLDVFTDCNDVRDAGNTQDGVYSILPSGWPGSAFNVFCNMTNDGGGWTVFQRRYRGATVFYKDWASYKNGFGDIDDEFWLGNDKLHYLTQQGTYELRVDFVSSSNEAKYSKYTSFRINSEANKYRVTHIGTYSGNGGNGMSEVGNDQFSTHDRDNDGDNSNCAEEHRGGWWYGGSVYSDCISDRNVPCDLWWVTACRYQDGYRSYFKRCTKSNLNGNYNGRKGQNIFWNSSNNCNVKYTEMKVRRIS